MRCWRYRKLLIRYKNNILHGKQAILVEEHITRCEKCRELLDWYKAMDDVLLELEPIGISQRSLDESWEKIKKDINRKARDERLQELRTKLKDIDWSVLKIYFPKAKIAGAAIAAVIILTIIGIKLPLTVTPVERTVISPKGELLITVGKRGEKVYEIPHGAELKVDGQAQVYINPNENGPTEVSVGYTYDSVSLFTSEKKLTLGSYTTAYIYPDGKIEGPQKMSRDRRSLFSWYRP